VAPERTVRRTEGEVPVRSKLSRGWEESGEAVDGSVVAGLEREKMVE
jgi:hypothetical protein